eukprot:2239511-Amphidinium_carterae.1
MSFANLSILSPRGLQSTTVFGSSPISSSNAAATQDDIILQLPADRSTGNESRMLVWVCMSLHAE